ncbi:NAD-dependent epimerase/dehydratase family protein [Candidatus Nitrosotenuis uzonensis]|uniref:UDP-glucose 4-epimerase n=1 Tax=Candidatus Nitrosotenuis uzonensis TaxID=1407055 RepID=V6AUC5_9ARCH|nr:NAD-dependent epimerase/dehydratase family protein [Candidatus Nitrosotenuis uzonensis]CDI06481.1 putative UDP-glucose 4-epimerase [Candidatus Nitrosotenuis uzonensis]
MRIAILGSQGFVGKNMVDYLDEKFDVISSDTYISGTGKNYVKADARKFDEVKRLLKDVDIVIDLIAHNLVSSFNDVIENANINIIGLLNILESCRINNVKKILFPSASSMIGTAVKNPVPETHDAFPTTPYGVTKLASEHYLRIYKELYGLNFVIFRFFNIYGPHQLNGLIPNIISRILKNQPVTIFGDGMQTRDFVYVKDVVSFFEDSIKSSRADNKILNMGTGKPTAIIDVVKIIYELLKQNPSIEKKPQRAGEISNFVADTTLLEQTFGKKPPTSVKFGLAETVDWYKKYSDFK